MAKRKSPGYWENPKNVDKAFDYLVEKLSRIPLFQEMPGGARGAIRNSKYPEVKSYNDYLSCWGFKENHNGEKWSQKSDRVSAIRNFFSICKTAVRAILVEDFSKAGLNTVINKYYSGSPYKALKEAGLAEGIEPWEMRGGVQDGYWQDPKNIDRYFDWKVEILRRAPKSTKILAGALQAMAEGNYPEVETFRDYLTHWGFKQNREVIRWDAESIDHKFDDLVETLRRIPGSEEMPGGALAAMREGNYSGAKTYNDYLRHWGFKLKHRNIKGLIQRLLED